MLLEKFIRNEDGQAVVEYVLLLVAVVSVIGVLKTGIRKITAMFWLFMARRIAAPCPACTPSGDIDF
jgi:Flp pilus assembly pilin Flp